MAIKGRNESLGRRIRLGMVGGGNDAFIGGVHRIASRIDDRFVSIITNRSTPIPTPPVGGMPVVGRPGLAARA